LLFGSGPTDAWTLIAVSALLGALSVAASWIPARRAARVDPMLVLSGG
jgi:ABC-type lipoprotein release transport system permease subunit